MRSFIFLAYKDISKGPMLSLKCYVHVTVSSKVRRETRAPSAVGDNGYTNSQRLSFTRAHEAEHLSLDHVVAIFSFRHRIINDDLFIYLSVY